MFKEVFKKLIYENPLKCEKDVSNFILEGSAKVSFENRRMRLSSELDPKLGQKANYVYWCNEDFPSDIMIEWDFYPISEIGLCILFFSAIGSNGESIFDEKLMKRSGQYQQYFDGDINTFHVSYYRTNALVMDSEPQLRTCNLRKSKGFYLVAQGGDPIPDLAYCHSPYKIRVIKFENKVIFKIENIKVFEFIDDGKTYGELLKGGKIGFRQMSPMIGEYANLKVYTL